jgi:iron complex transport system ATP-binding protein
VQLARVLAQIWNYGEEPTCGAAAPEAAAVHRVLFLDEPTTSLDIHFQINLLDVARDLTRHNCTVVAVLHDINIALQYGDVFYLLDRGRLAHTATSPGDIPIALMERVFRVHAHRITDPVDGSTVWRFTL